MGASGSKSGSAREAGCKAGESPVGGIRLFTAEDRANCVAARRGGGAGMESNRQVAKEMNHKDEPRKLQNRQRSPSRLGEGRRDQTGQQPWSDQRTGGVCVGDMSGSACRVSGEICAGGSDPTGSASSVTSEAAVAGTGVGDLHRSVDLWESQREQREVTCCAVERGGEGRGDGSQGLPTPDKVWQLPVTLYRKFNSDKATRKAGCGKTAYPV